MDHGRIAENKFSLTGHGTLIYNHHLDTNRIS